MTGRGKVTALIPYFNFVGYSRMSCVLCIVKEGHYRRRVPHVVGKMCCAQQTAAWYNISVHCFGVPGVVLGGSLMQFFSRCGTESVTCYYVVPGYARGRFVVAADTVGLYCVLHIYI